MKSFRLIYIGYIIARYRIDEIVLTTPLFYPFRFLRWFNPFYYIDRKPRSRGERIRLACEQLGPIFIKFGQVLSTRRDLLPDDVADELAKLQDQVPPFPMQAVRNIVESALNESIESLFTHFDHEALASASVAQVHAAELKNGEQVVVKVLRPNVDRYISRDIALLKMAARFMRRVLQNGHRIHPLEIIEEFERALHNELDLTREAANATALRHHSENSEIVYIPTINWDICRANVLVMERIHGIAVSRLELLAENGINQEKLAKNLIEMFFRQVFHDNFFHADLHPGNIFVDRNHADNPKILLVDFGIAGTLNRSDQRYIAENLLAFFNRDYQRVAELHVECGWLLARHQINDFAITIRAIAEPVFEKPISEISIAYLLLRLFHAARDFEIDIQPQLILLQKNLLYIESLSSRIYPDLNLWETAKPFLEKWLKRQMGMRAFLEKLSRKLPYWLDRLPETPDMLYQLLQEKAVSSTHQLPKSAARRGTSPSRIVMAGSGLMVVAALNFALAPQQTLSAWVLFGIGVALQSYGLIR